jgi:GNAT superfamily N-acetyltransferase
VVDIDEAVAAGTERTRAGDAGELLTLQLAAWVREGREARRIDIPPLLEELSDVAAQLADPALTIWVYRDSTARMIATVRTSLLSPTTAFLGRLRVVPDRSGEGIGGAMLRLAERRVPAAVTRMELITGVRSVSNHRFYQNRGYQFIPLARPDDDQPVVRLAKELDRQ